MKVMTHSLYPINLQNRSKSGELFDVTYYDDRYFLVAGCKISKKYFTEPFDVLEPGECKTPYRSTACYKCKKNNGQKMFSFPNEIFCYDCAKDFIKKCAGCGVYKRTMTQLNNFYYCNYCSDNIGTCASCLTKYHTGTTGSFKCMSCENTCKVCHKACVGELCNNHKIKTLDSALGNFASTRATAIETEVIGKLYNTPYTWRSVNDTSLSPGGVEFYSMPYQGSEQLLQDLQYFENQCEKANVYTDHSCGLHIHVDTRDFSPEELLRLYILCKSIEPWIYSIVIPNRKESKFCEPLDFTDEDTVEDTIYGKYLTDKLIVKRDKYQVPRYKWANFHSHFYRGSLEFRCHQGTTSTEKVYNWALLCNAIVEYAKIHHDIPTNGIAVLEKMNIKSRYIKYFKSRVEVMQ